LRLGLLIIVVIYPVALATGFGTAYAPPGIQKLLGAACFIVWAVGVLIVTRRDAVGGVTLVPTGWTQRVRLLVGICILFAMAKNAMAWALPSGEGGNITPLVGSLDQPAVRFLSLLGYATRSAAEVLLFFHLAGLADRIPRPRLARLTRKWAFVALACFVFALVGQIVMGHFYHRGQGTGWIDVPDSVVWLYRLGNMALLLATLVSWGLTIVFARAMTRVLRDHVRPESLFGGEPPS
jgi:hypothetical protein